MLGGKMMFKSDSQRRACFANLFSGDNKFAYDIDDYRNEMKCPIPETITLYRGTTDRALERDIKSGVMRTDEGAFSFALSPGYAGGYANKAGIYGAGEIEVLGHDTLFDKSIKPRRGAGGVPVILEIEVPITALSKHQQNIALYKLDTRKEYVDSGGGPINAGADYSDEFHLNNIPITYIKAVHEIGKERIFSRKED
jgi:hypothetical protein